MLNPRLTETLTDFPFARLNSLIAPITPPAHLSMNIFYPRKRRRSDRPIIENDGPHGSHGPL